MTYFDPFADEAGKAKPVSGAQPVPKPEAQPTARTGYITDEELKTSQAHVQAEGRAKAWSDDDFHEAISKLTKDMKSEPERAVEGLHPETSNWLTRTMLEDGNAKIAATNGLTSEAIKQVAGLAQTVMPWASDKIAHYTQKLMDFTSMSGVNTEGGRRGDVTPDQLTEDMPIFTGGGRVAGAVAPWLAGGEGIKAALEGTKLGEVLLGAKELAPSATAVEKALAKVPTTMKWLIVPGLMGASSYAEEGAPEDVGQRAEEGLEGIAINGIVSSPFSLAKKIIGSSSTLGTFIADTKKFAQRVIDTTPSLDELQGIIDKRFETVKSREQRMYEIRDARHGEKVVSNPEDFLAGHRALHEEFGDAPVETKIGSTLAYTRRELKVEGVGAAKRQNDAETARYFAEAGDYNKKMGDLYQGFISQNRDIQAPVTYENFERMVQGRVSGLIKPAPLSLVDVPMPTYNDIFRVMTKANAELYGVGKKDAARYQLGKVKDYLRDLVDDPATTRDMERTALMHSKEVVPFRKTFGYSPEGRATGQRTPFQVSMMAKDVIESRDPQKLRAWMKVVGPEGQQAMSRIALHNALDAGIKEPGELLAKGKVKAQEVKAQVDVKKMENYLIRHERNLRTLVGNDEYAALRGFLKLGGEVETKPGGHGHHPGFYYVLGTERLLRGELKSALGFYATGFLAPTMLNAFEKIMASPKGRVWLQSAAKMRPGSKELDELRDEVGFIFSKAGQAAALGSRPLGQYLSGSDQGS